jgi:N-acetylglucosaminyldiphosphoundecaprenol N-acetyl-beta-D-mannosaminyltransferase
MDREICRQAIHLLGVTLHPLTQKELTAIIRDTISANERRILANHNLHSIYLYHHDPKMREFYRRSGYVYTDGMSLIMLGRILGHSLKRENRLTSIDWFPAVLQLAAQKGWRIFYLGSRPGVAKRGAAVLKSRFSELRMETHHGHFNPEQESADSRQVIERINQYHPRILMVGMGMPLQEHWIIDHLEQLDVNIILNVGAYMDYIAGVVPTPPRWMGRAGLEWLYRLVSEPRRLWRRYLQEPWFLAGIAAKEGLQRIAAMILKAGLKKDGENQKEAS